MAFRFKSLIVPCSCLIFFFMSEVKSKVYEKCELALELRDVYEFPLDQLSTWICIANYESHYNTSAYNPGSGDHGLFQISELFWCSPDGDLACAVTCDALKDDDIEDDVVCAKRIYRQHTRISGNGFTAWVVYNLYCNNRAHADTFLKGCFTESNLVKYQKTDASKPGSSTTPETTPTLKITNKTTQVVSATSTKQPIRGNELSPSTVLKEKIKASSTLKPSVSVPLSASNAGTVSTTKQTVSGNSLGTSTVGTSTTVKEKTKVIPTSSTSKPLLLNVQLLSTTSATKKSSIGVAIGSTIVTKQPNLSNYVLQSTTGKEKSKTVSTSKLTSVTQLSATTRNKPLAITKSANTASSNRLIQSTAIRKLEPSSTTSSTSKTVSSTIPTTNSLFRFLTTTTPKAVQQRTGERLLGFGNNPFFHGFNTSTLFSQVDKTEKTPKIVQQRTGERFLGFGNNPFFQGFNTSTLFSNINKTDENTNIKTRETRFGSGDNSIHHQLKSHEKHYSTINKPDYTYTITSHGFRFFRNV